jgi:hypothetical protein
MQMVSENMFDLTGLDGTKSFLSHYVDGADNDRKFSLVADEIHSLRNVLAHQGYSSLQHRVETFQYPNLLSMLLHRERSQPHHTLA